MAETELSMISDIFDRLVRSCHTKCISDSYREGELNKGEGVCVDRSVLCPTRLLELQLLFSTDGTDALFAFTLFSCLRDSLRLPGLVTLLFDTALLPCVRPPLPQHLHLALLGSRSSATSRHDIRTLNTRDLTEHPRLESFINLTPQLSRLRPFPLFKLTPPPTHTSRSSLFLILTNRQMCCQVLRSERQGGRALAGDGWTGSAGWNLRAIEKPDLNLKKPITIESISKRRGYVVGVRKFTCPQPAWPR